MIRVYVEGVGLVGPGLTGWRESRPVLAGLEPYRPAPTLIAVPTQLPAAEARRTVRAVRLALAVAHEAFTHAGRDAASTATVFTASGGDGDTVHAILEILATPNREVSPTRFHNSVHNAAAGYWGIAARSHEPSTSLCGHDASFAVGLLEAVTQVSVEGKPVALIAYDHPYPEPLHATRPIAAAFASALILVPDAGASTLAALDVELTGATSGAATRAADPGLEALRTGVPAARCIPLLATLARETAGAVDLDYANGAHLSLRIAPCR